MKFVMIRHGITADNLKKAYCGSTDVSLSSEGIAELHRNVSLGLYPPIDLLFITPLKRTGETAAILYPNQEGIVVEGLREMDFGRFEGKNYEMLKDDPAYQAWLESNGTMPFPDGEGMLDFQIRCRQAFLDTMTSFEAKALPEDATIGYVVHGGTIMAVLSALGEPEHAYFDYLTGNCNGYTGVFRNGRIYELKKLFCDAPDAPGNTAGIADMLPETPDKTHAE